MIDHATSTGLLSKAEAVDLKKYSRTGKLDTGLWNKKQDLEGMNPFTIDLPRFNNQYNELFNRQTTEMETRYRTKIKDDSLKDVISENRISQLKINRQNSLILLIAIIAIIIGIILYLINRIKEKAVQEKKTIELLKVEADHRVKNTFNVINTIVRSVKSQSSDKQSFEVLEGRVEPLMILYDMLNQKNVQDIYLQDYFERICNNLRSSYSFSETIQVHIDAPVMLDGKKAGTVGLIVNELVTNAFKHAFPQDGINTQNRPGEIWIACKKDIAGGYNLHVTDSGIGYKETVININSKGLLQVKALAEQLSATINEKHDQGVFFEFYFM
jgi:two-component sensor histidine kinase